MVVVTDNITTFREEALYSIKALHLTAIPLALHSGR
jgi:hypothetical protein